MPPPRKPRPFFFQAEDGIRDYKVTGVQTCALPIPSAEIRRTVLFAESVTKITPLVLTTMPPGLLNRAAGPEPLLVPEWPARPARVVTKPAGVILRIVWFPPSAT